MTNPNSQKKEKFVVVQKEGFRMKVPENNGEGSHQSLPRKSALAILEL